MYMLTMISGTSQFQTTMAGKKHKNTPTPTENSQSVSKSRFCISFRAAKPS